MCFYLLLGIYHFPSTTATLQVLKQCSPHTPEYPKVTDSAVAKAVPTHKPLSPVSQGTGQKAAKLESIYLGKGYSESLETKICKDVFS